MGEGSVSITSLLCRHFVATHTMFHSLKLETDGAKSLRQSILEMCFSFTIRTLTGTLTLAGVSYLIFTTQFICCRFVNHPCLICYRVYGLPVGVLIVICLLFLYFSLPEEYDLPEDNECILFLFKCLMPRTGCSDHPMFAE